MFHPPTKEKIPRFIAWIGLAGAIVLITVALAYAFEFGFYPSESRDHWAQFGDYFGGTLGPILNFLGLIAILFTVILQARQLNISATELEETRKELKRTADAAAEQSDHFRRAERRTDIYRIIEIIATRLNKNFNENRLDENLSLHWLVINVNEPGLELQVGGIRTAYDRPNTKTHKTIKWVEFDLERLSHYITQYEEFSDTSVLSTPLPQFYRMEFGELVLVLHDLGCIKKSVYDFYCKQG